MNKIYLQCCASCIFIFVQQIKSFLLYFKSANQVAGEDAEAALDHRRTERTVTSANTDLLFSLFNGVEEEEAQRKIHLVRRGRPKKPPTVHRVRGMQQVGGLSSPSLITFDLRLSLLTSQDDDPCLVSTMTESLLPFLPGELFMLISLSNFTFTFLPGDLLLFTYTLPF